MKKTNWSNFFEKMVLKRGYDYYQSGAVYEASSFKETSNDGGDAKSWILIAFVAF